MTLDALAQQQLAADPAGAISVLVTRRGEIEQRLIAGEARPGVPLADDTLFLWLSAGKPVTATAIARLYEAGHLSIDDPVTHYVPKFAAAGKEAITIRHLLTHTAGLHKVFPAVWEVSEWSDAIDRICAAPLPAGFVPGEHAAYDPSAAWFLLGEIIHRITGEPFEHYIRREIFAPAGMLDAAFSYTDEEASVRADRLAQYSSTATGSPHVLNWNAPPLTRLPRPGASLRCTIHDLARFYEALLSGKLLPPPTLQLFTSPARGMRLDKTFGLPMDWALGFMVKGDPRAPYSFGPHAPSSAFGHGGQQTSIAFADPDQQRIVIATYTSLPGERAHGKRMSDLLAAATANL